MNETWKEAIMPALPAWYSSRTNVSRLLADCRAASLISEAIAVIDSSVEELHMLSRVAGRRLIAECQARKVLPTSPHL